MRQIFKTLGGYVAADNGLPAMVAEVVPETNLIFLMPVAKIGIYCDVETYNHFTLPVAAVIARAKQIRDERTRS